jgi:hypothetical protein
VTDAGIPTLVRRTVEAAPLLRTKASWAAENRRPNDANTGVNAGAPPAAGIFETAHPDPCDRANSAFQKMARTGGLHDNGRAPSHKRHPKRAPGRALNPTQWSLTRGQET